jgi:sodium transport system permease protein
MARNVRLLFFKELLGAVRDRRTLVLVVAFPLVFYPLVLAVMGRFAASEAPRWDAIAPSVAVVVRFEDPLLRQALLTATGLRFVATEDVAAARLQLDADTVDAVWVIDTVTPSMGLDSTLYYDRSDAAAAIAAERVRAVAASYDAAVARAAVDSRQGDRPGGSLAGITTVHVGSAVPVARMLLSRLLPYFLVLAILTGAMSFGAEITAGEKERGTIATLLVSQLSRTQIVLGKFLGVLTVSLVSSLLSAIGLMMGLRLFGSGLFPSEPSGGLLSYGLGAPQLAGTLVVLVPLAVVIAALVIIVGSFARSQKEASTYLIPVYMVVVLVGLASMAGGASLSGVRHWIPVANALFALQDVILGEVRALELLYTLAANAVVGVALVAASVRLFRREAILFRS